MQPHIKPLYKSVSEQTKIYFIKSLVIPKHDIPLTEATRKPSQDYLTIAARKPRHRNHLTIAARKPRHRNHLTIAARKPRHRNHLTIAARKPRHRNHLTIAAGKPRRDHPHLTEAARKPRHRNHLTEATATYDGGGYRQSSRCLEERGHITLEAALVMPILIAFLFFFYAMITAISAQMALQQLAAQAAQRMANYIHPVALSADYMNSQLSDDRLVDYDDANEGVAALAYELGQLLPHPLDTIVKEGAKGNYWPATNLATTVIGREWLEGLIVGSEPHSILNKQQVKLVYLQLPDLVHSTDYNVIVALQYDLPFKLPFFEHRLSVREQAMQRVWLPDSLPANFEVNNSNEEEEAYIFITSIEPNPLKPGRKATVKVSTLPNSNISLEVYYKSGTSVAKHLGVTTSNDQGEAEWTWHVSGNTTSGIWMLHITLVDKGIAVKYPFEVRK